MKNFSLKNILVILVLMLIVFAHCEVHSSKWDKVDKILFSTFSTTMVVDCLQTNYIFTSTNYTEKNPIIKEGVHILGRGFIPLYFIGCTGLGYYIADKISNSKGRKVLLSALVLMETICIIDNNSIGVKLRF